MTSSNIQDQEGNIQPPRYGFIAVIAVDGTSRGYDLTALQLQDEAPAVAQGQIQNEVFFTLENTGTSPIYFAFDSAAVGVNTINDAAATAAGGALTFVAGGCASIPGPGARDERINRQIDKTLVVKCATGQTSTLRIEVTSQSLPGATRGS